MHLFAALKMEDDKPSGKQQVKRKLFHGGPLSKRQKHNINDAKMK